MKKKVRILIGPNGSGKSTIKKILEDAYKIDFGYFINADDIERTLNHKKKLPNTLLLTQDEVASFLLSHPINASFSLSSFKNSLTITPKQITFNGDSMNSYEAAALADLLRNKALDLEVKFSYETVFSDASKLKFIKNLKKSGYQVYLYVVATLNPEINKMRVKQRVKNHGHPVPEEKIESRYYKALVNIKKAIPLSDRCFIIDNSQSYLPVLISEIENGKTSAYFNKEFQPTWAKVLLSQIKKKLLKK